MCDNNPSNHNEAAENEKPRKRKTDPFTSETTSVGQNHPNSRI